MIGHTKKMSQNLQKTNHRASAQFNKVIVHVEVAFQFSWELYTQ